MATFICLHGAGGWGSDWDLVAAELRPLGHEVVAPDLPADDEAAGLAEHAAAVVDAIGDRRGDLVLVAQSLSGFVAPLVCRRCRSTSMVLVAAMVPLAGETGCRVVGGHAARATPRRPLGLPDDSPDTVFLHDVPPEVLAAQPRRARRPPASSTSPGPVGMARRPDAVPRLPRRPAVPRAVAARCRAGPARDRGRRGARRPLRLPQPTRPPRRRHRGLLGRAGRAGHHRRVIDVHRPPAPDADGCVAVLAALPDHFTPDTHDEVRADLRPRHRVGGRRGRDEVVGLRVAVRGFPAPRS